jgi:hypothetical protein
MCLNLSPLMADEITVSAPNERVDLAALKRPRLGGKEATRLSHQPPRFGNRNNLRILARLPT